MNSLQQVAKAIGILLLATFCVVALVTVLVVALDFVLLIFLGILFSIFLTKTSQFVSRYLPIGYGWSLAIVTLVLLLLIVGGSVLLADKVQDRLQATSQRLDKGQEELVKRLRRHPSMLQAFKRIPFAQELVLDNQSAPKPESSQSESSQPESSQGESSQGESSQGESSQNESSQNESSQNESSQNESSQNESSQNESSQNESSQNESSQNESSQNEAAPSEASPSDTDSTSQSSSSQGSSETNGETGKLPQSAAGKVFSIIDRILSTTLGLVANILLIFFVGIFMAVDPALYRDGFARLFPIDRRERVKDILNRMGSTMFSWLMGRFMTMLITGAGTAGALLVLGVPMAITVGVITGLLTFVPNIGGILGLALAVLMALPQGLATVGWVVGLYAVLQLLESNVITPLLQQQQTAIPPALLLSFQVIMGALAGFLGLMVATPLLAASLVLVEQAWIKDVLGEPANET